MANRFLSRTAVIAGLMLLVCACDKGTDNNNATQESATPAITAATLGKQSIRSNTEHLASDDFVGADIARGEQIALQCRACHTLDPGGRNLLGPALHGFFGRPAGSIEGFDFSPVLEQSSFIWTPRALDAWLEQPSRFLPGNRMAYIGLKNADDRKALIAYLLQETAE